MRSKKLSRRKIYVATLAWSLVGLLAGMADVIADDRDKWDSRRGHGHPHKPDFPHKPENPLVNLLNDLNTLKFSVATLDAETNSLNTSVEELDVRTNTLDASFNALNAGVNALDARAHALDGRINTLDAGLNTLNSGVNALGARASTLDSGLSTLNIGLNALNVRASALDTKINTLDASVNTLTTEVNTLNVKASTLDAGLNTLNTGSNNLNARANTLETRVNTLDTSVNGVKTGVNAVNARVDALVAAAPQANILWISHSDALPREGHNLTTSNGTPIGATSGFVIRPITTGTDRILEQGLQVPPGFGIRKVAICYQLSHPFSFISHIKLTQLMTPDSSSEVLSDDGNKMSTAPTCVDSTPALTPVDPRLGPVRLSLGVTFTGVTHLIVIRAVGLYLEPIGF